MQLRFIRLFVRRLLDPAPHKLLSPPCLFAPAITTSRSPWLECDYNIHKSNSTYFTDLDMSRGNLGMLLFGKKLNMRPGSDPFWMILSGVQCVWRKEIKPYQSYEIWSRVLTWDAKWIYVVSHFVPKGKFAPSECLLKPTSMSKPPAGAQQPPAGDCAKSVFASCVARYVFKSGRRTIPPEKVVQECGLLPSGKGADGDGDMRRHEIEKIRSETLPIAQLERGWDAVHGLFEGSDGPALGYYTDL